MTVLIQNADILKNRYKASHLIEAVIDEEIEARIALNSWPDEPIGKDTSLDIAYQALWHFEADEDQQQSELFYMDTQIELLKQISRKLAKGETLPTYIIKNYDMDHCTEFYKPKGMFNDIKKFCIELVKHYSKAIKLTLNVLN